MTIEDADDNQAKPLFGNSLEAPCVTCGQHPLRAHHDANGAAFDHVYEPPQDANKIDPLSAPGINLQIPSRVYCLDCDLPAMESCVRWHTAREKGVVTMSEDKIESWLPVRLSEGDDIEDSNGYRLAALYDNEGTSVRAAYLVKAANTYPALVEVLQLLQGFDWQLDDSPHGQEIRRRAEEALALAEGEKP